MAIAASDAMPGRTLCVVLCRNVGPHAAVRLCLSQPSDIGTACTAFAELVELERHLYSTAVASL